ncbi:hypothetical protein [Celeribacter neptunius]|uniref:Uncharacterized protein n=1 Tax=Celeribacter neptunius TaxID=588602 RepID=A0A1I3VNZ4_9RHOB|nr:hypothetical protein [Celeribacter neptunius]SFJ95967.1 hypothetical protein SAMN04487991_3423 [Celeribacter neptunius]
MTQMNDPADTRFFKTLQQVLSESDAAGDDTEDHEACRAAVDRAIETAAPDDLRNARLTIDALPATRRDRLLAQVHARMAGDLSAIWDVMSNAQGARKPN